MIDAHQHFWRIGENGSTWPTPDLGAIHRDFGPEDLRALAQPLGVRGSVLVQSQESERDTRWLLALAQRCDFVKAVVGWTDLKSTDAPARIAALAGHPKLRGLRPMLQGLVEDDWICDPALEPAIAAMKAHALSFDALVCPRHLPHLRVFAGRHRDLKIVIDHGAKPPIASGALEPWRRAIAAIAELDNVHCKLSGLVTEAGAGYPREGLQPYVAHLVAAFGPDRLMWGSDWPVLDLAGHYADWLGAARMLCPPEHRDAIFAATAKRFYRI